MLKVHLTSREIRVLLAVAQVDATIKFRDVEPLLRARSALLAAIEGEGDLPPAGRRRPR